MVFRWTLLCAAVAALSACSAHVPVAQPDAQAAPAVKATYPSEHNQLRELGW